MLLCCAFNCSEQEAPVFYSNTRLYQKKIQNPLHFQLILHRLRMSFNVYFEVSKKEICVAR